MYTASRFDPTAADKLSGRLTRKQVMAHEITRMKESLNKQHHPSTSDMKWMDSFGTCLDRMHWSNANDSGQKITEEQAWIEDILYIAIKSVDNLQKSQENVERLTSEVVKLSQAQILYNHFKVYGDFAGKIWNQLCGSLAKQRGSYDTLMAELEVEYNEVANQLDFLPISLVEEMDYDSKEAAQNTMFEKELLQKTLHSKLCQSAKSLGINFFFLYNYRFERNSAFHSDMKENRKNNGPALRKQIQEAKTMLKEEFNNLLPNQISQQKSEVEQWITLYARANKIE